MVTTPAPDDDVEKILTGIMSKQSPLMKQARTQGLQSAQTAGLGQSTMGIKAAQSAAYNAAMPIASQQSQQVHQKGMQQAGFGQETEMQGREFGQQSKLQGAQFGQETAMQGREFGQQSKLQGAQFGQETAMQGREFGHQVGMQGREFGQQAAMQGAQFGHESTMQVRGFQQASHEANMDRAHQNQLANLDAGQRAAERNVQERIALEDRSSRERVAAMEVSAADKERALSAMTQFNNSYSAAYAQIATNENLPSDTRSTMLNDMTFMRNHNQNLTTSLYRNTVPW